MTGQNDAKDIDMRVFAKSAGANIRFGAGNAMLLQFHCPSPELSGVVQTRAANDSYLSNLIRPLSRTSVKGNRQMILRTACLL